MCYQLYPPDYQHGRESDGNGIEDLIILFCRNVLILVDDGIKYQIKSKHLNADFCILYHKNEWHFQQLLNLQ